MYGVTSVLSPGGVDSWTLSLWCGNEGTQNTCVVVRMRREPSEQFSAERATPANSLASFAIAAHSSISIIPLVASISYLSCVQLNIYRNAHLASNIILPYPMPHRVVA